MDLHRKWIHRPRSTGGLSYILRLQSGSIAFKNLVLEKWSRVNIGVPSVSSLSCSAEPAGYDSIVLLEAGPRHVRISWDPPAQSNGVLVNYTVLVDGEVVAATPPSTLDYNVTGLLPFTAYNLSAIACTSAGCVESSPPLTVSTQEDG